MPRNMSGVYSLPVGNPVVAGTVIESTWANTTLSDVATEITGSLPRNGAAPMTAQLILSGDATLPLGAVPLQQLQSDAVAKDSDTGSARIPSGTTAQRPGAPAYGEIRSNSTLGQIEWYDGADWLPLGGGVTGASGNGFVFENDITVTGDYTITTGKNGMSAGPITIDSGISVTVPSGSVWSVL